MSPFPFPHAVPVVTVVITTSGSAEVGMSYTLTCAVSGADNLEEAISIEFTGPAPNSVSGTGTSLQLPLTLDLNDAGRYTCTATVSSGLITSDIVSSDIEDITLQSECNSEVLQNSLWKRVCAQGGAILVTLLCPHVCLYPVYIMLNIGWLLSFNYMCYNFTLIARGEIIAC